MRKIKIKRGYFKNGQILKFTGDWSVTIFAISSTPGEDTGNTTLAFLKTRGLLCIVSLLEVRVPPDTACPLGGPGLHQIRFRFVFASEYNSALSLRSTEKTNNNTSS